MATTFKGFVVTVKDGNKRTNDGSYTDKDRLATGRYHVVAQFAQTDGGEAAEFSGATVGQNALYSLTMQFDIDGDNSEKRNELFSEKMERFAKLMEKAEDYIDLDTISVNEVSDHDGYTIKGVGYEVRSRNIAHWKSVSRDEIVTRMKASLAKQSKDDKIEWIDDED